jgi:hypothetical protein
MSVKSFTRSGLVNSFNYNSTLVGNLPSDYELIESVFLTGTQASVTFSNLGNYASNYRHLQIKATYRNASTGTGLEVGTFRFNGDAGANYSWHSLGIPHPSTVGADAAINQTSIRLRTLTRNGVDNHFASTVLDVLEPYNTTKNTSIQGLTGHFLNSGSNAHFLNLFSGSWQNTASITSIQLATPSSFITGSRFSIYGIKG